MKFVIVLAWARHSRCSERAPCRGSSPRGACDPGPSSAAGFLAAECLHMVVMEDCIATPAGIRVTISNPATAVVWKNPPKRKPSTQGYGCLKIEFLRLRCSASSASNASVGMELQVLALPVENFQGLGALSDPVALQHASIPACRSRASSHWVIP